MRANVRDVYAQDAYLNDTLKEHHGIDDIEAYFVKTADAVEQTTVEVVDVASSNGNYYVRWIMNITFKDLNDGEMTSSIGLTHLRFNTEGKVVFHQDYWDSASGFFDYVPVIGRLVRWVRTKI